MKAFVVVVVSLFSLFFSACGGPDDVDLEVATVDEEIDQSIQAGSLTSSHPAVGMVLTTRGSLCTGTLIARRVVLTAAHCVDEPVSGFYIGDGAVVRPGHPINVATEVMQRYPVSAQAGYPTYMPNACGSRSDVGLLLLSEPVVGVRSVPWARVSNVTEADRCRAVGFGANGSGGRKSSGRKRVATQEVIQVDDVNIVVRGVTGIADHGDSGGPLLCGGRVHGVTSCGPNGPWRERYLVYSRVDVVAPWIRSTMSSWGQ